MTTDLKLKTLEQLEERGLDKQHMPIVCEYLDAIQLRAEKDLLKKLIESYYNQIGTDCKMFGNILTKELRDRDI